MVKSIKWDTLRNLVHLEISNMRLSFSSMFHFLSSLTRKLRYLCIQNIHLHSYNRSHEENLQGSFHWMQTRFSYLNMDAFYQSISINPFENHKSFLDENSGFPELRYFRFEDHFSGIILCEMVFQFCCEKSPKLEQIHFVDYGANPETIKYVSKSIGKLSSRPTLRRLFIKSNAEADGVNDVFLDLFDCPRQKPNLENLSLLLPLLKLSIIGQFINGNSNLKKLSLDERLWSPDYGVLWKIEYNEKESFKQELLKILACSHGIEELKFVKHGWLKPWWTLDEKWIDRTIFRNEFPELLSYLETCEKNKKL